MQNAEPHVFIALYAGETVQTARLIAATADKELVRRVAAHTLTEMEGRAKGDTLTDALNHGRRTALRLVGEGCDA